MEGYTTGELTRHADDLMKQLTMLSTAFAIMVEAGESIDNLTEEQLTQQASLVSRILDVVKEFGVTMIALKKLKAAQ